MSRLEAEWKAGRILRLNMVIGRRGFDVSDGPGPVDDMATELGVERTPTFILFDASGGVVGRWVGSPPAQEELPLE